MKMNPRNVSGWLLFLLAIGFFCVQMGYFFFHSRYQIEYSDDRIFFFINVLIVLCLGFSLLHTLAITKKRKIVGASLIGLFIMVNLVLLVNQNEKVLNIVGVSPDFKHVLVVKENAVTGQARYYRTYYGLFARAKESLPYKTAGEFKVKWLADDVAAVTYKATDDTVHQYIGTYGDRGSGSAYYYVGPSLYGDWEGVNSKVTSDTVGIKIQHNGGTQQYDWDQIVQFGTLAVVLVGNNEAEWTLSLNENYRIDLGDSIASSGEISLYQATMVENESITLRYAGVE